MIDYTKLSDGELLRECGADGSKWASAFIQRVVNAGIQIDDGLMFVWFANAIETGISARRDANTEVSQERPAHPAKKSLNSAKLKCYQLAKELGIPDTNHTWSKLRMFIMDAINSLPPVEEN